MIRGMMPPDGRSRPRFLLEGEGEKLFLRMNSNNYLGLSFHTEVIAAEEAAAHNLGAGPGAVRFISGTWLPHIELERRLASFHGREAAMIFSSAYATVMGLIPPLASEQTAVLSDQLNHNCIINAIRLAQPQVREVYPPSAGPGTGTETARAARQVPAHHHYHRWNFQYARRSCPTVRDQRAGAKI